MPLQPYKHRQHGRLATLHWPEALDEPKEPRRMNGSFNNSSLFLEWVEVFRGGGVWAKRPIWLPEKQLWTLEDWAWQGLAWLLMILQLVSSKLHSEEFGRMYMRYILYFTWSQCKLRPTPWLNWLEWCSFSLISQSLPINSIRISVVMLSFWCGHYQWPSLQQN